MLLAGAALFIIAALLLLASGTVSAQLLAPALGIPAGLTIGAIFGAHGNLFGASYAMLMIASLFVVALQIRALVRRGFFRRLRRKPALLISGVSTPWTPTVVANGGANVCWRAPNR